MTSPALLPSAIVLVDDEPEVRIILRRLLAYSADGYQLLALATAAAALAVFDTYQVPLLITDYNMIGMNGLELTQAVKARSPSTQVLVTSAYHTPQLERQALAAGADYYLPKPFPFDRIQAIVKAALATV
jgi:two-component system, response regulator, stage 0 sporulation protein F